MSLPQDEGATSLDIGGSAGAFAICVRCRRVALGCRVLEQHALIAIAPDDDAAAAAGGSVLIRIGHDDVEHGGRGWNGHH
jgi:hypothetical protein